MILPQTVADWLVGLFALSSTWWWLSSDNERLLSRSKAIEVRLSQSILVSRYRMETELYCPVVYIFFYLLFLTSRGHKADLLWWFSSCSAAWWRFIISPFCCGNSCRIVHSFMGEKRPAYPKMKLCGWRALECQEGLDRWQPSLGTSPLLVLTLNLPPLDCMRHYFSFTDL